MRFAHCRKILAVVCAVASFSLAGCADPVGPGDPGGKKDPPDSTKTPPPPPPPRSVVDTIRSSIMSPRDNSVIAQSATVWPKASVSFSATIDTTLSSKGSGKVTGFTFTLDSVPVPAQTNAAVGEHKVCATAVVSDTTAKGIPSCSSFSVSRSYFAGKLRLAGSGTCSMGTKLYFGPEGAEDSVDVSPADCSYTLDSKYALSDTTRVVCRGPGMIPCLARVPSKYFTAMNIVGVPSEWCIAGGVYAGQCVTIDLEAAYKLSGDGKLSFFQRNRGTPTSPWIYAVESWQTPPAPVAFCSARTTGIVTPSDTATYWNLMDKDHYRRFWTKQYFAEAPVESTCGDSKMGVELFSDTTTAISHAGPTPDSTNRNYRKGNFDGHSKFVDITCFANSFCVYHEMTHILGIGHTCSWLSVMNAGCSASSDVPTVEDVAYTELMMAVADMERMLDTRLSLGQAHQGFRVFVKGLSEEQVLIFDPGH